MKLSRLLSGARDSALGFATILLLAQCSLLPSDQAPLIEKPKGPAPDYWTEVKPVFDRRCVVCHACYDAPCQLNLTADEGVERGASKDIVYDAGRLREGQPTRLLIDATTTAGWRKLGFYTVLNTPVSPEAARAGALVRMLALKRQHPQPTTLPLPGTFDFGLSRAQQCAKNEEFDRFSRNFPLWGMPYGLPAIDVAEDRVLTTWIDGGAPWREPDALPAAYGQHVAEWELFLNGTSPKERLMSRFVYEHLFIGDLYFDDLSDRQFFHLVRSRTPPGQPIDLIASRRPFDDPGVPQFWYRLQRVHATTVAKTHLAYPLGASRLARYRELFLAASYTVTSLPGYDPATTGNPFITFQDMPVESRYRFLLDDAAYFIGGFVKGPVCRGQVALDSIEDRFWVVFVDPDNPLSEHDGAFLARESGNLRLPDNSKSGPLGLAAWSDYRDMQVRFLQAKQQFIEQHLAGKGAVTLDLIWDGDGRNPNAGLTIFRHFDSASVVQGFVGTPPKTAWVMGFALFERIHYLLVAGFDVYGNAGHQLDTRLYMDFMRMEGEFNFIALLPRDDRKAVRDYWYRGAKQSVLDYVYGSRIEFDQDTGIQYASGDPRVELLEMLRRRLAPALNRAYDLDTEPDATLRASLSRLVPSLGRAATLMPEDAFLAVVDAPGAPVTPANVFSVLRDTAHTNVASLFGEEDRLIPAENALTVARGFIGAYPNAYFRVTRDQLPVFVAELGSLQTDADYHALVAQYGVSRVSADFWRNSDQMMDAYAARDPAGWGVLDYSRLENR